MLITFEITCPFCGDFSLIDVLSEDVEKHQKGKLIQKCFPYLDASEREVLISGVCVKCQKDIFKED